MSKEVQIYINVETHPTNVFSNCIDFIFGIKDVFLKLENPNDINPIIDAYEDIVKDLHRNVILKYNHYSKQFKDAIILVDFSSDEKAEKRQEIRQLKEWITALESYLDGHYGKMLGEPVLKRLIDISKKLRENSKKEYEAVFYEDTESVKKYNARKLYEFEPGEDEEDVLRKRIEYKKEEARQRKERDEKALPIIIETIQTEVQKNNKLFYIVIGSGHNVQYMENELKPYGEVQLIRDIQTNFYEVTAMKTILEELKEHPEYAKDFKENYKETLKRLKHLDEKVK